jgi:hypothetical protein
VAKHTARKFEGDDSYSWAVFRASDIPKGRRGVLFWEDAKPVISGMSRDEAQMAAKRLSNA